MSFFKQAMESQNNDLELAGDGSPAEDVSVADGPLSPVADRAFNNAVDDASTLERMNEVIEDTDPESIPESSRLVMETAMEAIRNRLIGSTSKNVVSLESFKDRNSISIAIEENKNIVSRVWDAIVKFFKGIYEWIVNFFSSKKTSEQAIEKKAEAVIAAVKGARSGTPPAGVEVIDDKGDVITFTSDRFTRITGKRKTDLTASSLSKLPFVGYYAEVESRMNNAGMGPQYLMELQKILATQKAKDTARHLNEETKETGGLDNLNFEYIDSDLGRSVTVSPLGAVSFTYPENEAVEYSMKKSSVEEIEAEINRIIGLARKNISKQRAAILASTKELEKINKVIDQIRDPGFNKDNVSEAMKSAKALFGVHVKLFTDVEKDYSLVLDLFRLGVATANAE